MKESNEVKRLRRVAKRLGVKFNRVNNQKGSGYRIFSAADFAPVASIDGIACNYEMTLGEVANFLAKVFADRLKIKLATIPEVNI